MFGVLMKLLARAGRDTTADAIAGPTPRIDLRDLIYKDLEMYGITNPTAPTFARLVGLIQSGELKPLLEEAYALPDLAKAQARLPKRTHVGKIVVTQDRLIIVDEVAYIPYEQEATIPPARLPMARMPH